MDEQKLKARIGALRDQLEKLGERARVPSRSAGKSARALDDVRGGLEQLRARCEELLDTGREGRRLSEAGAPGGGELAGALLEGLPHLAIVVDRDNTVLAANRIARLMGVKSIFTVPQTPNQEGEQLGLRVAEQLLDLRPPVAHHSASILPKLSLQIT